MRFSAYIWVAEIDDLLVSGCKIDDLLLLSSPIVQLKWSIEQQGYKKNLK